MGGSLPGQTWHDIMVAAHQGVEIKDIAGYPAGPKVAAPVASATVAANGLPNPPDIEPGPPPILIKRGADILVRVEKILDDAGRAVGTSSTGDSVNHFKASSTRYIAFPRVL